MKRPFGAFWHDIGWFFISRFAPFGECTQYREQQRYHLPRMFKYVAWVMALLALLMAQPALAAAPAAPIITITAEAGYGGYTKPGAWTPVRISVSNVGDPVEAVIQLTSSDANNPAKTRASVSLPRGARRTLTLYAAPGINAITVQVMDNTGVLLATATPVARPLNEGDHLALAINDPPDAYTFLADGAAPGKRKYVAQLRIEQLPDLAAALDSLDEIVIGNADTGAMTAAQRGAIRGWLVGGGQLVIAGGPGAALSSRGFADILPAQVQPALLNIQNPAQVMSDFARPNSLALTQTAPGVITSTAAAPSAQLRQTAPDAQILLSAASASGEWPLIIRRAIGRGVIDQLAFDPTLGGWADDRAARLALFDALSGGRVDVALAGPTLIKNETSANNAARAMQVSALPSVLLIAVFLALFVMAIGPGNYLILRRVNRLSWAWVTVPALVLAFTLGAALLGAGAQGGGPTLNRLTVWMGDARLADGRASVILGVFSPRRADLALELGDGLAMETHSDRPDVFAPVSEDIAQPNRIAPLIIESGAARAFYARGQAALAQGAGAIQAALTLTPSIGGEPARLGGLIRNFGATPLTDCVLIVGRDYQAVGSIAPGAGIFAEVVLWQNEAQSHFGAHELSYPYGGFQRFRSAFNSAPRSSQASSSSNNLYRNSNFDLKGPPVSAPFIQWRAASNKYADQAQQELVTALFDTVNRAGDGANLACWGAANPLGAGIQSGAGRVIDTTLFVWRLPVQNVLLGAGQTLPPDAFEWRITGGGAGYSDNGLSFEPGSSVVAFTPWLNARTSSITNTIILQMDAALNAMSDQLAHTSLQIYDWRAQGYVWAGESVSQTNALTLTGAYASPAGEVRLRLNTGADGLAINALRVSLTGGR